MAEQHTVRHWLQFAKPGLGVDTVSLGGVIRIPETFPTSMDRSLSMRHSDLYSAAGKYSLRTDLQITPLDPFLKVNFLERV